MNWFFFCSLLSPWFRTRDALPKEDNSRFCQCHWSAHQIFVPFGNHNVFFFCYSQQMLFNAVDGFWIYYCSLYENPMNGNNRNNDKNIASEWEQPNKLMRSEITRKKWNERTWKRERETLSAKYWSRIRFGYGKYRRIKSDSSNADSKSMNGI